MLAFFQNVQKSNFLSVFFHLLKMVAIVLHQINLMESDVC